MEGRPSLEIQLRESCNDEDGPRWGPGSSSLILAFLLPISGRKVNIHRCQV